MSWDILLQDFGSYGSIEEIPGDFTPKALGNRADIIRRICAAFPEANFSDPSWGLIDTSSGSIEVNISSPDECDGLMLHVRGNEAIVEEVLKIAECLSCRAFDCSSGSFLTSASETEGLTAWREYCDQVISDPPQDPSGN